MQLKISPILMVFCLLSIYGIYSQELNIENLQNTLKTARKSDNLLLEIQTDISIGDYYLQAKNDKKAENYFSKSLSSNKNNQFTEEAVVAQRKIGLINQHSKDFKAAKIAFQNALTIANESKLSSWIEQLKTDLIQLKIDIKEQDKADKKYQEFKSLSKSEALDFIANETNKSEIENEKFLNKISNLSKENQLAQLKLRLNKNEVSKQELQIELLNQYNQIKDIEVAQKGDEIKAKNAFIAKKEIENEKQRLIIGFSIGVLILLIVLIVYIYRGNMQRNRHNELLKTKNQVISTKNKEITDSIHYAKRIQEATLQSSNKNSTALADNFILFQPKDIVSGDFYWIRVIDNKIIWAVADCTGHGVPGAFMSMIGNRLLNEIIIERKIYSANLILDELKSKIIQSLNQEGKSDDSKDGMDIAICILDKDTQMIDYAGANNPIYIVKKGIVKNKRLIDDAVRFHENDLVEIKPNRFPIGYNAYVNVPFVNYQFKIEKDDVIYMFSDGYSDQFGGERDKKFTSKRFKEMLISIHELPMEEQKKELLLTFQSWKNKLEQLDDVCVIGVRL